MVWFCVHPIKNSIAYIRKTLWKKLAGVSSLFPISCYVSASPNPLLSVFRETG